MKLMRSFFAGLILVMLLWASCFKEPSYSIIPSIALAANGLKFTPAKNSGDTDTLLISLRFTDGDGDLGLDNIADNSGDYVEKYYTIYFADYTTGKLATNPYKLSMWTPRQKGYSANTPVKYKKRFWVSTTAVDVSPGYSPLWKEFFVLTYKAKRTIPAFQSFPEFVKPYNCTAWDTVHNKIDTAIDVIDTLNVEYNPNYYNIFVDVYTKNPDGTFSLFDPTTYFTYPNCDVNLFNGRFPILAKNSNKLGPLAGVINYSMRSVAFTLFFGNKKLKLKTYILDRAKHKSNLVETPEFTLQSIKSH